MGKNSEMQSSTVSSFWFQVANEYYDNRTGVCASRWLCTLCMDVTVVFSKNVYMIIYRMGKYSEFIFCCVIKIEIEKYRSIVPFEE